MQWEAGEELSLGTDHSGESLYKWLTRWFQPTSLDELPTAIGGVEKYKSEGNKIYFY